MSQPYRGLRDSIRTFIPIWMQDRAQFRNFYKVLYTVALMLDIAFTWCVEAVYAWFPGYSLGGQWGSLDASTALPLIARSRGILQGEGESPSSFAARLVQWLRLWEAAGSSEILASQIQAYLGNHPMVRIVDRSGFWVTVDSAGNVTTATASWNWDSVSNPERAGWWSDLWIIVYPTEWPITGTSLLSIVGLWGTGQLGTGHAVPRAAVNVIATLKDQWKGAHCWIEAILWSYDSTLFVPGAPVAGDPDGTWGQWWKMGGSSGLEAVVARTGASDGRVRYWIPDGG